MKYLTINQAPIPQTQQSPRSPRSPPKSPPRMLGAQVLNRNTKVETLNNSTQFSKIDPLSPRDGGISPECKESKNFKIKKNIINSQYFLKNNPGRRMTLGESMKHRINDKAILEL